jgi:ribose/xylose/arabinose/galactoside ABC-type transport system permease subunit
MSRFAALKNTLGLLVALAALYALFAVLVGRNFTDLTTAQNMLKNSTIVGLVAVGMTYVIVSAGIDLSVGSMVAFVTVVFAVALERGSSIGAASSFALLAGVVSGVLNGVLIVGLRITPFIVTLGTLLVLRGAAKGLAGGNPVYPDTTGWVDGLMGTRPGAFTVPPGVWILAAVAVVAAVALQYTRFGRHAVAVGSNEQAARLCGVAVGRVKVAVYALVGLCAFLAGLVQVSLLTGGDPTIQEGLELQVIAAVVIGGASLSGGTGSIGGTLLGVLVMEVIRTGSSLIGWPTWVQQIVTGAIIVAAVALDRVRHRRQA